MQTQWSHHVHRIVMAKLAIKQAGRHLEMRANLLEEPSQLVLDDTQRRA